MMSLETVDEVIDKLQTVLTGENYSSLNLTTITIDWDDGAVIIEYNLETSTILFEKEFFESKSKFLQEIINSIKKFSLLNIYASVKVCDYQLPIDRPLYETKSCKKFSSKVYEFSGLHRNVIFELQLPINEAELYFFSRPDNLDEDLARLLITSESFNSALVNSLYAEMMNASDKFEHLSFLGRIKSSDHQILKKIVDTVVRNLLRLLGKQEYVDNNSQEMLICAENDAEKSFDNMQIGLIDLTTGLTEENQQEIDDETFYDFNTSDIMETDYDLRYFYDPIIKGLKEGWDATVEDRKYKKASCDENLMEKFLSCLKNTNNTNPVPWESCSIETEQFPKKLKRSKSEDDLQIISVVSNSDFFGENTGKWKFRQRDNGRVVRPPLTRMSLGGNRTIKPVKSNLFNDEEVVKWEKSKGADDMSKLLSSTRNDYKPLNKCLDKDYKIPRKSYNGPTPRPSIHNSTKDSKMLKPENSSKLLSIFQKRVDNLAPYDSPSGYRITEQRTPASVSNFFNTETIHVIDDDDEDDNNNNTNKDKVLQKGPVRRKLYNISPKAQPKIFKNRRTDYKPYDNPFSSGSSRNSSSRRQNI